MGCCLAVTACRITAVDETTIITIVSIEFLKIGGGNDKLRATLTHTVLTPII